MNSVEKEAVLHCLKAMIDEEVCEECPLYGTTGTDHCEKDCVRLAINALEQEPYEDAISRQVVLDMLENINAETEGVSFYYEHYVEYIKNLQSVTPQPKTGQWIDEEGDYGTRCSECKKWYPHKIITKHEVLYCSSCGAKMQEVEE